MELISGSQVYERALEAAGSIQKRLIAPIQKPAIGVICGSGLGGLAEVLSAESRSEVHYADIPHFPQSTGNCHKIRVNSHSRWQW